MVFSLPQTLVKTLAKNLATNLVNNLAKHLVDISAKKQGPKSAHHVKLVMLM